MSELPRMPDALEALLNAMDAAMRAHDKLEYERLREQFNAMQRERTGVLSLQGDDAIPDVLMATLPIYNWPIRGLNIDLVRQLRIIGHRRGMTDGILLNEALERYLDALEGESTDG